MLNLSNAVVIIEIQMVSDLVSDIVRSTAQQSMLVTQLYGKSCFLTVEFSDYPTYNIYVETALVEYADGYPVCVMISRLCCTETTSNLALKTAPWLPRLQLLVVFYLSIPVTCWPFSELCYWHHY